MFELDQSQIEIQMYDNFKDSARVTLNDKYISDEGCGKLAEFLSSHRRIQALELKSNDIGPQGFQLIFKALAENPNLRYLILQYNNLGTSYQGVEQLGSLLSVLSRLEYLNISNNKLQDQAMQILSTPISLSKSLKLVEMKFNNLTSKGLQALVGDLKRNRNTTLLYVDFAGGNKVDKQVHEQLEEVLKGNRKNNPIGRDKITTINVREGQTAGGGAGFGQTGGLGQTMGQTGFSRTGMNIPVDELGRENMLRHMETILEQNRRNSAQMKIRMQRELEQLIRREKIDARELTDLESKCNQLVLFNRNLKFQLDRILSEHQQQQRDHNLQLRNHDQKLREANRELSELQTKYTDISEKMSREHQMKMKEIAREWEQKLRGLEERIRMAEVENNDIENDIRKAMEKRERARLEVIEEENGIVVRVQDEEAQRYNIKLTALEAKLAEVTEAREMYLKRNNDIVFELEKTEQKNQEEIASLQGQLADLQEKQELFMKKNKEFVAMNERLTGEIRLKEMSFEKLESEINSLNEQIELKKRFNKQQVEKVLNEQAYEKNKSNSDRQAQMAKLAELERVLRASQIENTRLRQEYVALAETVQLNVSKAIESVFTSNNLF